MHEILRLRTWRRQRREQVPVPAARESQVALTAGAGYPQSACKVFPQMFNDGAVLLLRAERDDLRIPGYRHGVAGQPVEKAAAVDGLFRAVPVSHFDLALNYIAKVRRMTQVALQTFQQRCNVPAPSEKYSAARLL
jgi:hypothetical protein